MLDFILPLFGRFHPLLVHLPIGILVFGIILVFLSKAGQNTHFASIRLAFLLGGIAAAVSSVSGFLQYQYEGFEWESIQFHLILALLTTAVSFWLWYQLNRGETLPPFFKIKSAVLVLLLTMTGHLGGNISRGENYLTEILPLDLQSFLGIEIEPEKGPQLLEENWENAALYSEVIQPILNQNCKSCHNPRNLKGELDLTTMNGLLAGGEDGLVLTAGDATHSELYTRMILEKDHDDHMPPAEKRQPSKEEIALIEAWIQGGGKEKGTLAEAAIPRKLIEPFIARNEVPFYPVTTIPEMAADSLAALKLSGFFAEGVESGSGLLKVSCINFPGFQDSDWTMLAGAKNRLAYLDLSGTKVSDSILDSLGGMPNLTVLKLNNTAITGKSLEKLALLPHLKLLYLNNTGVNLSQIQDLTSSKSFEKVFVYETPAAGEISNAGKLSLPFLVESGNYTLPKLATDTIVY
ncbi:ribonuclease inhibitor [Algoriphagus jejuensis]|uniref:Ribonuclease inhibitor n=1 Tax=Algoriphagus jejuensis TaxID=419934 RepID=A0ABP3YDI3_9BACT